jgi:hypothetical protein
MSRNLSNIIKIVDFSDIQNNDNKNTTPFTINKVNTIRRIYRNPYGDVEGLYSIYKYETESPKFTSYFSIPEKNADKNDSNIDNLAILVKNKLYIIRMVGNYTDLENKIKISDSFYDEILSETYTNDGNIYEKIDNEITIPNHDYITGIIIPKNNSYNFTPLNNENEVIISIINSKLKETCPDYEIVLDYVYNSESYKNTLFDDRSLKIQDFILCLMDKVKNICLSSVILYTKDFIEEPELYVFVDLYTMESYKNRNMNKFLSAVTIIIAPHIHNKIRYVTAVAVNPVAAYTMMKYFNAIPDKKYINFIEKINKNKWNKKEIENRMFKMKYISEFIKNNTSLTTNIDIFDFTNIKQAETIIDDILVNNKIKCIKNTPNNDNNNTRGGKQYKKSFKNKKNSNNKTKKNSNNKTKRLNKKYKNN